MRVPAVLAVPAACGCAADLLPGERVVPGEVAAEIAQGEPGASFGAAVAVRAGEVLVGAPGAGTVTRLPGGTVSAGPEGLGAWTWWWEGVPWAGRRAGGAWRVDGDEAVEAFATGEVIMMAGGETADGPRLLAALAGGVVAWDAAGGEVARFTLEPDQRVERVAVTPSGALVLRCAGDACEALAWSLHGPPAVLGAAGPGGALEEVDGEAWWGDPEVDVRDGEGSVVASGGAAIRGEAGEHLGRALCTSHAAGVFSDDVVPARLRLRPLAGGPILAVDRYEPGRAPVLHAEGDVLAVGLPSWDDDDRGRVLVVDLDALAGTGG